MLPSDFITHQMSKPETRLSDSDDGSPKHDTVGRVAADAIGAADAVGNGAPTQAGEQGVPANFELALSELEAIVGRMESGELTLEHSLTEYRRGTVLLKYCQAALRDAQQQVKILEAGVLKDFTGGDDNG